MNRSAPGKEEDRHLQPVSSPRAVHLQGVLAAVSPKHGAAVIIDRHAFWEHGDRHSRPNVYVDHFQQVPKLSGSKEEVAVSRHQDEFLKHKEHDTPLALSHSWWMPKTASLKMTARKRASDCFW